MRIMVKWILPFISLVLLFSSCQLRYHKLSACERDLVLVASKAPEPPVEQSPWVSALDGDSSDTDLLSNSFDSDDDLLLDSLSISGLKIHMTPIPVESRNSNTPIAPFYLGTFEVTQLQWETVMGKLPKQSVYGYDYPVENVDVESAKLFIRSLNYVMGSHYRLPTMQEWMYAANEGKNEREGTFAGCTNPFDVAWFHLNTQHSQAVGQLQPNAFGIFDLAGNVSEYCSEGDIALLKGGCWYDSPEGLHDSAPAVIFKSLNTDDWFGAGLRLASSDSLGFSNYLLSQTNKVSVAYASEAPTFSMVKVKGGKIPDMHILYGMHGKWITVPSFQISAFEVTQEQWMSVMGGSPSNFQGQVNLPVENVSAEEVELFLDRLNKLSGKKYRLPTVMEWEYVYRGGTKSLCYLYAGSDSIEEVGWVPANSEHAAHPVGLKIPNELGIYDLTGNVSELCKDGNEAVACGDNWSELTVYQTRDKKIYRPIALDYSSQRGFRLVLEE